MPKKGNLYQGMIPRELYDRIPKSVFAALAVSFASAGGRALQSMCLNCALVDRWDRLHDSGIVPQKPTAGDRRLASDGDGLVTIHPAEEGMQVSHA